MATTTRARAEQPTPTRPPDHRPPPAAPAAGSIADALGPLLEQLIGPRPPVRVVLWDGSEVGPADPIGTIRVKHRDALRQIVTAPGELGLARAFVSGNLDVEGPIVDMMASLAHRVPPDRKLGPGQWFAALRAARRVGALGLPPARPEIEARRRGRLHSKARDARAISHHYDVGNDFYDLVLGPAMTYSCARFTEPTTTLVDAQAAKHELVCRKLGLHERPGARLLDVGCGWGSMAIHAATHHGASVVGVTISKEQVERARERVAAAGLTGQIEIRLQDYRDLQGESFDVISSIGMFEHVGKARTRDYFETLRGLLGATGRLLNHAISSVGGSRMEHKSFTGRYVFPDGELLDVADVVAAMEGVGFEVRDVESLREHYARTLRCWVANLEADWDRAVELVGEPRARAWRLYMAGSAVGFEDGGVNIHQVLGVLPTETGRSAMPPTRSGW